METFYSFVKGKMTVLESSKFKLNFSKSIFTNILLFLAILGIIIFGVISIILSCVSWVFIKGADLCYNWKHQLLNPKGKK